jgi:heme/copper-type cytochrome/quinol oxidase subunit 4
MQMQIMRFKPRHPGYLLVFIGLLVLLGVGVLISYLPGLDSAARMALLLILLVVELALELLYYMHLRIDSYWYLIIFLFAFVFAIGLAGTFVV